MLVFNNVFYFYVIRAATRYFFFFFCRQHNNIIPLLVPIRVFRPKRNAPLNNISLRLAVVIGMSTMNESPDMFNLEKIYMKNYNVHSKQR